MKIIEIDALANGAHRNQDGNFETVPCGWAVIPDDMEIPDTFPFVNIETEEVEHTKESMIPDGEPETYTVVTVTKITAGIVPEPEPAPVDSVKAEKITEIKKDCEEYIYAGADVTYADGIKEHFTYTLADQSNISEMFTAIMAGATEYPYHADGEICKIYTKEQIVTIYGTLSLFKTEATTYHNSLKAQVNAMTDASAISVIKFKETVLTGEYLANYTEMMTSAQTQLNAVLAKIPFDEAV